MNNQLFRGHVRCSCYRPLKWSPLALNNMHDHTYEQFLWGQQFLLFARSRWKVSWRRLYASGRTTHRSRAGALTRFIAHNGAQTDSISCIIYWTSSLTPTSLHTLMSSLCCAVTSHYHHQCGEFRAAQCRTRTSQGCWLSWRDDPWHPPPGERDSQQIHSINLSHFLSFTRLLCSVGQRRRAKSNGRRDKRPTDLQ